jgi:hypothetical protein
MGYADRDSGGVRGEQGMDGARGGDEYGRDQVEDQNDSDIYSIGTDFKIMAAFNITAPESGAPVNLADGNYTVAWNTDKGSSVTAVNLYYTNNGDADPASVVWNAIAECTGTSNDGQCAWTLPTNYADQQFGQGEGNAGGNGNYGRMTQRARSRIFEIVGA